MKVAFRGKPGLGSTIALCYAKLNSSDFKPLHVPSIHCFSLLLIGGARLEKAPRTRACRPGAKLEATERTFR